MGWAVCVRVLERILESFEQIDRALAELGSEPTDLARLIASYGGAGLSLQEADAALLALAGDNGFQVDGGESSPLATEILSEENTTPSLMPPPPLLGMVQSLAPPALSSGSADEEPPKPTLLEFEPPGQEGKATLLGVVPAAERAQASLPVRAERSARLTLQDVRSSPPPGQRPSTHPMVEGAEPTEPVARRTPVPASPSGGDLGEMVRASQPPATTPPGTVADERTAALSLDELRAMASAGESESEEQTATLSLEELRTMASTSDSGEDSVGSRAAPAASLPPSLPPSFPPPTPVPSPALAEASNEVEDDFELLVDEELLEIDDDDLEIID